MVGVPSLSNGQYCMMHPRTNQLTTCSRSGYAVAPALDDGTHLLISVPRRVPTAGLFE